MRSCMMDNSRSTENSTASAPAPFCFLQTTGRTSTSGGWRGFDSRVVTVGLVMGVVGGVLSL